MGASSNRAKTETALASPSPLEVLTDAECSIVLTKLVGADAVLSAAANDVALGLLASATIEEVASEVSAALLSSELDELGARTGKIRGRGYVHETDAAWELVEEAFEPFLHDMRRRALLGLLDAASVVVIGVVGLYGIRDPDDGSVLAYAGPDCPEELASALLDEAHDLGVDLPADVDRHWPSWSDQT
ncbi:MAG: hypothetical protein ACR2MB_16640 [Acidimicrobiales bacterium]